MAIRTGYSAACSVRTTTHPLLDPKVNRGKMHRLIGHRYVLVQITEWEGEMKSVLQGGLASLLLVGPVSAAELGATHKPIRLAVNEWTGQHISTYIAGGMLEAAGYTVEYVTAGYMNMFQAMSDGEIHAAMEIWSSNVSDNYARQVASGGVVELGNLGLDAREGIAYPAHVGQLCPGLPRWEALKECAQAFATAETIPMGRLVDYPADWGTPGADRVAGLELPFRAVPAGSEGALIAELRAATTRKSPLLITFWQPHWAMSAYDVQFVDLPPGTPECYEDAAWGPNPHAVNDCDFLPARIFKAGWSGLKRQWPAAFEVLSNYQLAVEDQQPLMGAVDVDGGEVATVVAQWMNDNPDRWRPIVNAALK